MGKNIRILASEAGAQIIGAELSRRGFLAVGAAGSVAALAACSGGTGSGGEGGLEGQLSIYTWAEYDDPGVLSDFTAELGPRITVDAFNSNEEAIAKLVSANGTSGYDIVVPTGTFVPQMIENGLLEQLDLSQIPNIEHVMDSYLAQAWDPNNEYSIVKTWGTVGYCWDSRVIDRDIVTWNDFIDVAQNEASGKTCLLDVPVDIAGIYFWANGIDWTTTDEADLDACEQFLVNELAPHISQFDSNPGTGSLISETAALYQVFNGDARLGFVEMASAEHWKYALGSPATELWMDNWCIVKGAQNTAAAHAFINFVLDPEQSLRELMYTGYDTGVEGVAQAAKDAGIEYPEIVFVPDDKLDTLHTGAVNEAQARLIEIYNKFKAAAG